MRGQKDKGLVRTGVSGNPMIDLDDSESNFNLFELVLPHMIIFFTKAHESTLFNGLSNLCFLIEYMEYISAAARISEIRP